MSTGLEPSELSIENDYHRDIVARIVFSWVKQYDEYEWLDVFYGLLERGSVLEVSDGQ